MTSICSNPPIRSHPPTRSHHPAPSRPVVAVIGPSAVGKSTVVRALQAEGLVRVHPTWTTRPRRRGEVPPDVEHRFVTDAVFDAWERAGYFAAVASLPGLPHRYALPVLTPTGRGAVDVVVARAAAVPMLAGLVPALVVYQIEDDRDRVADRLAARGLSAAEVAARLGSFEPERRAGRRIADRVLVNDDQPADLADELARALAADVDLRRAS
jgi:guanylate kinase